MDTKMLHRMANELEKNEIDPLMININIEFNKNLQGWLGNLEPEDLCTVFSIEVIYTTDLEADTKTTIGNAICYQIDTINSLTGEEQNLFEIADSISGGFLCAISPFLDDEGMVKIEYMGRSILYIDSIMINKDFRNKGLGSFVLKFIAEELLKFASIIVIIPHPVEHSNRQSLEFKKAKERLINFYESLGFGKISDEVWKYHV